eukprot:161510_1
MATGYTEKIKSTQRKILLNALNTHELADVTFIIGEQETEYNINRIFLSLISPVFKAMLYGKMKESELDSDVIIKDMKPEIFECIISFAYCNDPKITNKNVLLLLQACDKYQIQTLSEICHQQFRSYLNKQTFCTYFHDVVRLKMFKDEIVKIMLQYFTQNYRTCLSSDNFCEFFSKIVELDLSDAISKCEQFLQQSNSSVVAKICNSDGFAKMELKTVRLILTQERFECSEERLWDAVLKWAEYQSTKNVEKVDNELEDVKYDGKVDDVKAKEYKLYLLKSVKDLMRFGLMDGAYFAEFVEPEKIFNNKELITILLYFHQPKRGCGVFSTTRRMTPKPWNETFCGNPIKYQLNVSIKDDKYSDCSGYDDMIDTNLAKRLVTQQGTNEKPAWIEAEFNTSSVIRIMQIGSTNYPKEINGHILQLKNANGEWIDVMKLPDFAKNQIKTFYMVGTGTAARIISYNNHVSVGYWNFFTYFK